MSLISRQFHVRNFKFGMEEEVLYFKPSVNPFTPRESEFFEKSGFKIFKALSHANKADSKYTNQLRISSTFKKILSI